MDGPMRIPARAARGLGLLMAGCCGAATATEPMPETTAVPVQVQEVLEVWRERELATPAFVAQWQETIVRSGDSLVPGAALRGEAPNKQSASPDTTDTVTLEQSLCVNDSQLSFRSSGPQWMPEFDQFAWRDHQAAYQPPLLLRLFHTPRHPIELQGFVQRCATCPEARRLDTLPLLLAFRPLHPIFSPLATKGQWVALPEAVVVDGRPCLVIERQECHYAAALEQGEVRESFWVDPAHAYAVRRYELMQGECMLVQATLVYDNTSLLPETPTSWSLVAYGGNPAVPRERHDGTLTECKQPAAAIKPFEFPVGTLVNDGDTKSLWIARPSGVRRLVTEEEQQRRPSYAELLVTESGQAGLSSLPAESALLWTLIVASALGAAFRLRRRRTASV